MGGFFNCPIPLLLLFSLALDWGEKEGEGDLFSPWLLMMMSQFHSPLRLPSSNPCLSCRPFPPLYHTWEKSDSSEPFLLLPSKQQPVTTSKSLFFRRPPLSLPPIVSQRRLLVFYRPKLSTKCAVLFIPFPTRRPHSPLKKNPFFLAEGDDVIMTLFSPPLSSHQPPPQ